MEIEGQEAVQDDQMSNCRSFGSNYHPSSQSRKISIGVMIDSLTNIRSGGMKDDEVAVLNAEMATSKRERKNQEQGLAAVTTSKQNEAPEKESSPWINTKSVYKKRPTMETVYSKQTSNLHIGKGRENKVNGTKETPKTSSIQFFANQNSMLQSGNENQKKFNRVTDRSSRGKDGTTEMEKFPSSSGQGVGVSDKGGAVDKINKTEMRSEALKMKLWEALGNVSSPNKQFFSGAKTPEMDANSSMVEPKFDQQERKIAKPRQNSDSIEPDSESPDATTRRPVTRSLTRKRAPSRVQAEKVKIGPSSSCKQKLKEKSIFSFKVGLSGELHDAVNGVLQKTKKGERKKGERKSCPIEPRKIWFPEKNNAERIKPANDGSKVLPPSEKASLLGNRKENFQSRPQNNEDHIELKNRNQEKDFHGSPATKKADEVGDVGSPESADGQEDLSNPSLNILKDLQDLHSPTFQMKTPGINSSPHSPPRTDGMEQGVCSPFAAERIFTLGAIHCFRTLPTPKRDYYGSKMQSESSDDAEELRVCPTPTKKSVLIAEEKDARNESSKSSSEERDSDCYKEISSTDEGCHSSRETDISSPENVTAETPKFIHPAKRLRSHGGNKFNDFSPASHYPKGTEGRTEFHCSEQNQEDGLSRAISLFSLALERIKCKMEREASKRSSEIAMSVAEGIQLQLQNVQSQMQKDVGKLTSLSKLKRRRLETRFQEQQEQLKLIHEKFKDEINQHMQDCRSSIEGLEVHQIELKRNLEKQKASHQKLLLQVEEVIEIQLNDAQQRIAAIHKMARQKMLQLKLVLGECLKDGIVS